MAELFVDLRRLELVSKPSRRYYTRRPSDEHITHLLRLFAPKVFTLGEPD